MAEPLIRGEGVSPCATQLRMAQLHCPQRDQRGISRRFNPDRPPLSRGAGVLPQTAGRVLVLKQLLLSA